MNVYLLMNNQIPGRVCSNLIKFHLTLWREDMTDVRSLKPASDTDSSSDITPFANVQVLNNAIQIQLLLNLPF